MESGVLVLLFFLVAFGMDVHPGGARFSAILGKLSAERVAFLSQTPPQTKKERVREEKRHYQELSPIYKSWLNEDVVYIITPEERAAFLRLNSDVERDEFIEQFWYRRNPSPDLLQNQAEIEHYRRIAFADKHFAIGKHLEIAGWKTDRGHAYIVLGPPDRIESRRVDVLPEMQPSSLTPGPGPYPEEIWHYQWIPALSKSLDIEFVKSVENFDFVMVESSETELQQANWRALLENLPSGCGDHKPRAKVEGIQVYVGPECTGVVRFKDLEALVTSRINRNNVKFELAPEFEPVTSYATFVRLRVRVDPNGLAVNRNLEAKRAGVRLFGRFTNSFGRVAETFEDEISVPTATTSAAPKSWPTFKEECVLRAGTYSLSLVVGDSATGNVGTSSTTIVVPPMNK